MSFTPTREGRKLRAGEVVASPALVALEHDGLGGQVAVLCDSHRSMKARCAVLPGNTVAIHSLEIVASLALDGVGVAGAATDFVLTKSFDMHFRVHFLCSLNRLLDRRLAVQDEHLI